MFCILKISEKINFIYFSPKKLYLCGDRFVKLLDLIIAHAFVYHKYISFLFFHFKIFPKVIIAISSLNNNYSKRTFNRE